MSHMQSKKYTHRIPYILFCVKFNFKHVCNYIGVVVMSIRKMGMVNENKNEYILHLHSYIHTYTRALVKQEGALHQSIRECHKLRNMIKQTFCTRDKIK